MSEVSERRAATVLAGPAHRVRVIDVQVKLRVSLEQLAERFEWRKIAEHRVNAVAHVPDRLPRSRVLLQLILQQIHAVVAKAFDYGALEQVGRHVQTGVRELIDQHDIVVFHQHRQGREVCQRSRGRDQGRSTRDHVERVLEFAVQGGLEVRARELELGSVLLQRGGGSGSERRMQLQRHVAAGAEVAEYRAANRALRPVTRLGAITHESLLARLFDDAIDGLVFALTCQFGHCFLRYRTGFSTKVGYRGALRPRTDSAPSSLRLPGSAAESSLRARTARARSGCGVSRMR